MTAQAKERLLYQGEETWIATEPLQPFLQNQKNITLMSPSSACLRGYYGEWELRDNQLYLVRLTAFVDDYREVDLSYLFPGKSRVFAQWFSGEIRVPRGLMLDFVHRGYESLYEKDEFLIFEAGVLNGCYEVDNHQQYRERLQQRSRVASEAAAKQAERKQRQRTRTLITLSVLAAGLLAFGLWLWWK
jgi:hypothetical protein